MVDKGFLPRILLLALIGLAGVAVSEPMAAPQFPGLTGRDVAMSREDSRAKLPRLRISQGARKEIARQDPQLVDFFHALFEDGFQAGPFKGLAQAVAGNTTSPDFRFEGEVIDMGDGQFMFSISVEGHPRWAAFSGDVNTTDGRLSVLATETSGTNRQLTGY